MNTGKLYMFRNGISQYLAVPGHSIHLNLLGIFNELGDDNRMILADISSQLEEAFQFVLVRADVHGSTTQHIAGTYQYRETYSGNKPVNVFH